MDPRQRQQRQPRGQGGKRREQASSPERREALLRKRAEVQEKLGRHVSSYPVRLAFPANVHTAMPASEKTEGDDAKPPAAAPAPPMPVLRTDPEFVQERLLEAGVEFEETRELGRITEAVARFADDLRSTGCYDSARVVIGREAKEKERTAEGGEADAEERQQAERRQLDVILEEKRWYSLYVGGGLGARDLSSGVSGSSSVTAPFPASTSSSSFDVPRVRLESTASLLNLTGKCDVTSASYSVDQTGTVQCGLNHTRPLYSLFSPGSPFRELVLNHPSGNGTRTAARVWAEAGTDDHERTRSCREHTRTAGVRVSNYLPNAPLQGIDGPLKTLEWSAALRDVVPRRHPTLPYAADASPEIVAQSGPSLKHSVSVSYGTNGTRCDSRGNPTRGYELRGRAEVAGPPGDVGFVKVEGGCAAHVPLAGADIDDDIGSDGGNSGGNGGGPLSNISLHLSANAGLLRPLAFGGLCPPSTLLPDRFHVGGPLSLRGFLPCGVGPRSAGPGGRGSPGGDALGGEFYCTSTLAASMPFPGVAALRGAGARIMAFGNAGTLTGGLPLGSALGDSSSISPVAALRSARVSAGVGIVGPLPGGAGRFELTYAVPLRHGPRDARRRVQLGAGVSFG